MVDKIADQGQAMEIVSRLINTGAPYVLFAFTTTRNDADIAMVSACSVDNLILLKVSLEDMILGAALNTPGREEA